MYAHPAGGTPLTLKGTNFAPTGDAYCLWRAAYTKTGPGRCRWSGYGGEAEPANCGAGTACRRDDYSGLSRAECEDKCDEITADDTDQDTETRTDRRPASEHGHLTNEYDTKNNHLTDEHRDSFST